MKLNIIFAVVSVIISLAFSEIAIRVTKLAPIVYRLNPGAAESAYKLSENTVLGYELKANYRNSEPNYHQTFPYINSFGQRDIERRVDKEPGVKRVILLGDSVVAGHGIVEIDDLINRELEQVLGNEYEVLNFGIGGYCTLSEIELLKTKALKFSPDLVVVLFVENDYVNRNAGIIHRLNRPVAKEHSPLIKSLFFNSHLFRYLSIKSNYDGFGDEFRDLSVENGKAIGDNNVRDGFKLLKSLSLQHEFETLIALWPNFSDKHIYYTNGDGVRIKAAQLPVESIAQEIGLETVRLDAAFKSDFAAKRKKRKSSRKAQPRWVYTIGDSVHPSRAGSEAAARIMAPLIISRIHD